MWKIIILICLILFPGSLPAQSWRMIESPTRQNLARLDMTSPSAGMAVSYDGLILSCSGGAWQITDSLGHIFPLADNQNAETPGDIYTIILDEPGDGWIAVNDPKLHSYFLLHYRDGQWQPEPFQTQVKIRAFDLAPDGTIFAVGESGGYYYHQGAWQPLKVPVTIDLRAVQVLDNGDVFLAGERGKILHKSSDRWREYTSDAGSLIRDMDFISDSEGWFVGNSGVILHFKDGSLEQELGDSAEDLWAVDMLSRSSGYAVGKNGTILQYNGETWEGVTTSAEADLHDIEMTSDSTGFIVGAWGTILELSRSGEQDNVTRGFLLMDQVHLGSDYLMDRIDDVQGVTVADFNGDDVPDIYLTGYRSLNHLLINDGNGVYNDRVIESGTGGNIETRVGKQKYESGSLAADFDRDGDCDLFLGGLRGTSIYLINKPGLRFENVTAISGLPDNLNVIDGALADLNHDGYPDLLLADENFGLRVFRNQKYNRFTEIDLQLPNMRTNGIRSVKSADLNGDGEPDLLLLFHHGPPVIYLNKPQGWTELEFRLSDSAHFSTFPNSASIADLNGDGFNDIFICSEDGHDRMYLYDSSESVFTDVSDQWGVRQKGRSYTAAIADYDLDGDLDVLVTRFDDDIYYENQAGKYFRDLSNERIYSKAGFLSGYNTGAAVLDLDANGRPDIVAGNLDYWSSLLRNQGRQNNSIRVKLIGSDDTYEAIGGRIRVTDAVNGGLIGFREIILSNGYFSQSAPEQIIGIGNRDRANVTVEFPGGVTEQFTGVTAGSRLVVYEENVLPRALLSSSRSVMQFIHIPDVPFELAKLVFFLVAVLISVRFLEKRYRWRPAHLIVYVLGTVVFYGLVTIVLRGTENVFYHLLPFLIIAFTLVTLAGVNEPIRREKRLADFRQKRIQDAGNRLARTTEPESAGSIVLETLRGILEPDLFAFYLYNPESNVFARKKCDAAGRALPKNFEPDRNRAVRLGREKKPLTAPQFISRFAAGLQLPDPAQIFVLAHKSQLIGIAIIRFPDSGLRDPELEPLVQNILLQLTMVLYNQKILAEMREQQNLAAIGTFSSGILHNLKNPIEGLRMITEILSEEIAADDPRGEYVSELKQGIGRLKNTLLHSFDPVYQRKAGRNRFLLNELLHEIVIETNKNRDGRLILAIPEEEAWHSGVREEIKVALISIISNAFEASRDGQPVNMAMVLSDEQAQAEISICDRGTGIPPEQLEKIYDIFYSTRGDGRGLGLTIARNIIKNHEGIIRVESRAGQGTCFRVILPLENEEEL
jgi:signal transduction histidine kinase